MKKSKLNYLILAVLAIFLVNCSSDKDTFCPLGDYIKLEKNYFELSRVTSNLQSKITSSYDIKEIKIKIDEDGLSWCQAVINDDNQLVVSVLTNPNTDSRKTTLVLNIEDEYAHVSVIQKGIKDGMGDLMDDEDIQIEVLGGEASSQQPGEEIEKSFDGSLTSMYHSDWYEEELYPYILDYTLAENKGLDYIIYHPRVTGPNGIFLEFDLFITTEKDGETNVGKFEFEQKNESSKISLDKRYEGVESVRFEVTKGVGGFASCAEMEFFTVNDAKFDYLTIFSDLACSVLKSGITLEDINNIPNEFYRDIATEIYNETYSEFRVQDYKRYLHPDVQMATNKSRPYGQLDNVTGIYVNTEDQLVLFVDKLDGQDISVVVQDLEEGFLKSENIYGLVEGYNKLSIKKGGLVYVLNHTRDVSAAEKKVKVHFATGYVNGYFDSQKHDAGDWAKLLSDAKYREFDVIGKYAHLTFPTAAFKAHTPDGKALIDIYDDLVYEEQDFLGLVKNDKMFSTRAYFKVSYADGVYMHATHYRTVYHANTMPDLANVSIKTNVWGPAHEVGHVNQISPDMTWVGMTEVSNNILALHVQTTFGGESRLMEKDGDKTTYDKAYEAIALGNDAGTGPKPHAMEGDPFYKLAPFWQLKLYLMDAQGKTEFYKDLAEHFRVTPSLSAATETHGVYQLDFVRQASKAAQLDLSEFFETWGFLTPLDEMIEDYTSRQMTITQAQVDALKQELSKYAKPKHSNIHEIRDDNVDKFK